MQKMYEYESIQKQTMKKKCMNHTLNL